MQENSRRIPSSGASPRKETNRIMAIAAAVLVILSILQLPSVSFADTACRDQEGPIAKALSPTPQDMATSVPCNSKLQWANGGGAKGYIVYVGTSVTLTKVDCRGITNQTCFYPGALAPSKTYYWRVDSIGLTTAAIGDVWSFTTSDTALPPARAKCPSPPSGAFNVALNSALRWEKACGATGYDVYLGSSLPLGDAQFRGSVESTYYSPGALAPNQAYYWRIDSKNASGKTLGETWTFRTAAIGTPGKALNPAPADGSASVTLDTKLRWSPAPNAAYYKVYFGSKDSDDDDDDDDDQGDDQKRCESQGSGYRASVVETYYNPGPLAPGRTYMWRIDAVNASGVTAGDVWRFSTTGGRIPPLCVTEPGGGSAWKPATTHAIKWTADPSVGESVRITLYKGEQYCSLLSSTTLNDGTFEWTLPERMIPAACYRIKVTSLANPAICAFSQAFKVLPPTTNRPEVTITCPNVTNKWQAGYGKIIKWTCKGQVGSRVRITLYKGNKFLRSLATSTTNDGSFAYNMPTMASPGGGYRVKITSLTNSAIYDWSDNFTVTPKPKKK